MPRRRTPHRSRRDLAKVGSPEELDALASKARYRPSTYHQENITGWRPDKSKCPAAIDATVAKALLLAGIRKSMFSSQRRQGWPRAVWAVCGGVVYEARLANDVQGEYHGYPLPDGDPFAAYLASQWSDRS